MPALYETHIPVADVARSVAFYRDVIGLVPAFEQRDRGVAFLYVGERANGMVGLWAPGSLYGWKSAERPRAHFAISTTLDGVQSALARLKRLGVTVTGFGGKPCSEPSVIGWMPSAQIYFTDPDGNLLEFIALLDDPPRADFFGSWSQWLALRSPQ